MVPGLTDDSLAEKLIDLALKRGAEAAEVLQSRSRSRPVFFEANRLKQLETSAALGTALRLWINGRPGLAVAYGNVDPEAIIDKALAISALNDPETVDLVEGNHRHYPDMGQEVPVEQLIDWGQAMIDRIRSTYPEVICGVDVECDVETTRILNTKGLDSHYSDATLSSYLSADWVRGDDFLSVSDGQTQRDRLEVEALTDQVLQRLAWAEEFAEVSTGRMPVIFTAKAADMIWGTLQSALSGKRVVERSSPWSSALGEQMTSPRVTLLQDPEAGPFSCPFDDEGTPTQRLVFIDKGVVTLFYCDRAVGRTLGAGSTGNGFRPGLGSYPTPSLYNTLVETGTRSLEALIASVDNGVLVDQILGGDPGIAGDFSVNIDLGYRIHRGKLVGRVKDTMVAGNIYTALKDNVELGSDGDWNGSCYTPSVLLDGLSVTSG
ncbi:MULTISPECIES: TldD/PmbA family protein [Cyanophyceae]|uniref:TldD/PmbA family protein n=1 Tax=Cyanophyceae TaxID=3028117 RepID=UPI001681CECB|nr:MULTISPECIES: TldD/PmbA family protein [Cyanophyceae]MBD1914606.1 TldD/PmbA family protein [Phormidium sp. FACHB-77]MBD2030330.1 TldD/PmbA family protein [Phormidium sp. FACHB-322]MBD2049875.1 TldD/PmbA family protein [Leptolyngbya sp. FACHB-60]